MNVLSVLQAQSTRIVRILGDLGYLPNLVMEIGKRYQFIGLPRPEQLLPSQTNTPMTFEMGKVQLKDREIAVNALQIYPAGLAVITRTNTSDCDLVLDEVMEWATDTLKLTFEPIRPGNAHNSQLELRFNQPLATMLSAFNEIGAAITEGIDADFWRFKPAYELTTLTFFFDKTKAPSIAPTTFRLDRRDGSTFEDNLFWSEAPLSTDKHIAILGALERICERSAR